MPTDSPTNVKYLQADAPRRRKLRLTLTDGKPLFWQGHRLPVRRKQRRRSRSETQRYVLVIEPVLSLDRQHEIGKMESA
jgi:hypothetical protein